MEAGTGSQRPRRPDSQAGHWPWASSTPSSQHAAEWQGLVGSGMSTSPQLRRVSDCLRAPRARTAPRSGRLQGHTAPRSRVSSGHPPSRGLACHLGRHLRAARPESPSERRRFAQINPGSPERQAERKDPRRRGPLPKRPPQSPRTERCLRAGQGHTTSHHQPAFRKRPAPTLARRQGLALKRGWETGREQWAVPQRFPRGPALPGPAAPAGNEHPPTEDWSTGSRAGAIHGSQRAQPKPPGRRRERDSATRTARPAGLRG